MVVALYHARRGWLGDCWVRRFSADHDYTVTLCEFAKGTIGVKRQDRTLKLSSVSLELSLVAIGCRIGIAFCDGEETVRSGCLNTVWSSYWMEGLMCIGWAETARQSNPAEGERQIQLPKGGVILQIDTKSFCKPPQPRAMIRKL